MTDIHCHVLPGVDDGARDMDESLDMLAIMYDEGIRNVIMTPHYHGGHVQPDIGMLRERLNELRELQSSPEAPLSKHYAPVDKGKVQSS